METANEQMQLMFSFFEGVVRKGPGSKESTLKALGMLSELPPRPRIVDFGCGSGAASLALATAIDCLLTAVDVHQPFLDDLKTAATRDRLSDRIKTVQADMAAPPFPDRSFDLIWSEAAIYNVGFEAGLRGWRRLLSDRGYIAVSEAVWLTPEPPRRSKAFWDAEYPSMTTVDENLNKLCVSGYDPIGHFILPPADWENYYGPLEKHLAEFRIRHSNDANAKPLADSVQREIDVWRECGNSYGYVFFLGRAT